MDKLIYDSQYFGLHRPYGYSNYEHTVKDPIFLKRAESVFNLVSGQILELGCATGVYQKIAITKGLNWQGLDGSEFCYDHKVADIIHSDALEFLIKSPDNYYNWIVSFSFLECFNPKELAELKKEIDRVSENQIHKCFHNSDAQHYNNNVKDVFPEVEYIG